MALRRLKRDGCIQVDKHGRVTLLQEGRRIADRLLHRHHLIERMLTELFGMEWYKVHDEAEQLEHAVSAEFERLLAERLVPTACPPRHPAGLDSPAERRSARWKPMFEMTGARPARSSASMNATAICWIPERAWHPSGSTFQVAGHNYDDTLSLISRVYRCNLGGWRLSAYGGAAAAANPMFGRRQRRNRFTT